jgi:4-azaleucine resistance transporter AzlC
MIEGGATLWALTAMALVVNLRHMLYGLNIGKKYSEAGTIQLLAISFGIVDETYAFNTIGPGKPLHSVPYFLGTALCAYIIWNTGTLLGALAGKWTARLETAGLDFAMVAVFISMIGSSIRRKEDWYVVGLTVVAAILVFAWTGGYWHLFIAGLAAPAAVANMFRGKDHES